MEKSFQVGADGALDVRIASGKVEVKRGQEGVIVVSGRGDTGNLSVEQHGSTVWVSSEPRSTQISKRIHIGVGRSVYLSIEVPEGIDIDVNVASADFECEPPSARINVNSASGDIRFTDAGELTVKTASGDVHGHKVSGKLHFVSASGDLHVESIGDRASISTASGDIQIGEASGPVITSTMSGDVQVRRFGGDDFAAKSMSGSVDIGLPAGSSVDVEATTLSGEIILPEPRDTPSDATAAGTVDLKVKLVSGDLKVR
ncbi:MAG: DUF4097 family beta strand repeat-containing protein, partial [Acidimicrobiia bacterium]